MVVYVPRRDLAWYRLFHSIFAAVDVYGSLRLHLPAAADQEGLTAEVQQWKLRQVADTEGKSAELADLRCARQAQVEELTRLRQRYKQDLLLVEERKVNR